MTTTTFPKHQIDYLYHMTAVDNLESIFRFGLLSHSEVGQRGLQRRDISNREVQQRRQIKRDPFYHRSLHEYVCLYFAPRNPMLCVRKDWQDKIIILGVDRNLLLEPGAIYTDGNAAASETNFYSGAANLDSLQWDIIQADYWNDYPDGKRIKCAEVLIYPRVEARHIHRIYCSTPEQYHRVVAHKGFRREIVAIRKSLFFVARQYDLVY